MINTHFERLTQPYHPRTMGLEFILVEYTQVWPRFNESGFIDDTGCSGRCFVAVVE